ncbi:MAG: isochorismatase family protein [Chloroflexi bacterium]|nr:isochorismatase family protein [Chloroflexota bacterium]
MSQALRKFYEERGLAHRIGFGQRPAVIVIDLQNGFTDTVCPVGSDLSTVIGHTNRLIDVAHGKLFPVIFTLIAYEPHLKDGGVWLRKMPGLGWLKEGTPWVEIDKRLSRNPEDPVVRKKGSSAFFGTHLASMLQSLGVDTLALAGCTTSGCVRATALDAVQLGFRSVVPVECVGDRAQGPHEANLFDIDAKYSDVMPLDDVLRYLEDL